MFSKLSVIVTSVLITLAAAMPNGYYPPPSETACACTCMPTLPASSAVPPTSSAVPPTSSVTPPTSVTPSTSVAAPPTSATPPTSSETPSTSMAAPPTSSATPPTSSVAPPTSSATPPTSPQCCTSVQSSSNGAVSAIAALLGLDLSGLDVPIGLGCSPITVIGNNCGSTTVNCEAPKEQWGGLIAINCIPITL
ncbi:hypothetical protein FB451DRAFT_1282632 [Mycena latifolia]|nr:hypothetical protein FB451DRAFT_1282632 [Mycena latifolia]